MKRFAFYYIVCCSLLTMFACSYDDVDNSMSTTGDAKITIASSLDNMAITRSADSNKERAVEHIDVFAIDASGNIAYYERNVTSGNNNGQAENGAGILTLNVTRRAKKDDNTDVFTAGAEYKFYLIANSTLSEAEMQSRQTLRELELLLQDDSFIPSFASTGPDASTIDEGESNVVNSSSPSHDRQTKLHLSGTQQGKNPDPEEEKKHPTPQTFLMDAVASDSAGNSSWVVNPSSGSASNLELKAEFKRAAAKIIVNITQGKDVEFRTELLGEIAQYDFYKLPCETYILPSTSQIPKITLVNTAPMQPNDETFIWANEDAADDNPVSNNTIQIVGYAYAHQWNDSNLTDETSLILNIPMMWNMDNKAETGYNENLSNNGKEAEAPRSWYKVPLSQKKSFERNKCYIVNITINAVGASTKSTAIKLDNIEYQTLPWQDVGIDVGEDSMNPEYLMLNTDLVEMYNVNLDTSSLRFSSSSPITSVVLKDVYKQNSDGTFTAATDNHKAYYINKFGIVTDLESSVVGTISATAEKDVLSGGINIMSPILSTSPEERDLALQALGDRPAAPSVTKPVYTNGEIPTEPTAVAAPVVVTQPSVVEEPTLASYGLVNSDNTEYRYNASTKSVQKRTKQNSNSNWGNWSEVSRNGNSEERSSASNFISAMNNYNTYLSNLEKYNNYLKAKEEYDNYVIAKEEYDRKMALLMSDPVYVQYINELEAYNQVINAYESALAIYNEQLNVINASATAGETHYNTIRYLEFEVTNEQGLKATFRVMQYPVVYITNIQGWYSYREDFGGTTLESKGTNVTSNTYFKSKVAFEVTSGNNKGQSDIYQYSWSNNQVNEKYSSIYTPGNARMYHVKITATSDEYTLGKPRLDAQGYTESSAENNTLVSPSFMLASQLGALASTFSEIGPVRTHCQQYVEVYKDKNGNKVVLDDWRLPTRAELEIIIKYQYSSDAMDEVIRRQGYWCADGGQVTNSQGMSGSGYLRCIRDAY